ncbi:hypothetical protein BSZ21_02800 [Bradyrhizobium canariense]|jgi:hypothetical protein|nr:hypothetical protein BST65_13830 [Bradyrhizobium canariense]OSI34663.1 hypothetical protein BST66_10140 [Bradyrhizobium canariense]OSI46096.1 hypothetical protein BSZ20_11600 [Bradyrhizobium canariense]OSI53295.1 hypothetical protein BST67_09315 [Bradyrhizobium canariense]OSI57032.1 hypothetical protein BSZ15_15295 [Bradyrhizobium canariense]
MLEIPRCDHCEEEFAPEELIVLAPPAGDGELICGRCIEVKLLMLHRIRIISIAQLPCRRFTSASAIQPPR